MDKQAMVREFHSAFEILINDKPTLADEKTQALRVELITEELKELAEAYRAGDIVGVADGLADLLYVVYGAAVSHGIQMDEVFAEVHRSNMSKVGGYKREDGKWVKPPTYSPANLGPLLERQKEW